MKQSSMVRVQSIATVIILVGLILCLIWGGTTVRIFAIVMTAIYAMGMLLVFRRRQS